MQGLAPHELEEKIEKGGLVARIVIEVLGKPKEHVDETLKLLLTRLREESQVIVGEIKIADAEEVEESQGMFSTFAEIEIAVDSLSRLVGICFFYMPASIEVVEPAEFNLASSSFNELYNDLLGQLHNVDMVAKNLRAENEMHKRTMGKLLRSSMLALTKQKKSGKDIADLLMIPPDQAENILDKLVEEGLLKKVGKNYGPNR